MIAQVHVHVTKIAEGSSALCSIVLCGVPALCSLGLGGSVLSFMCLLSHVNVLAPCLSGSRRLVLDSAQEPLPCHRLLCALCDLYGNLGRTLFLILRFSYVSIFACMVAALAGALGHESWANA